MESKEQDPALQSPAEANRDKHMNYLAAEEQDTDAGANRNEDNKEDKEDDQSSQESIRNKHDADSGNDGSTNQMLQHENLIDPGNEHNHISGSQTIHDDELSKKFDADAGGDGTGTMGSKPGK